MLSRSNTVHTWALAVDLAAEYFEQHLDAGGGAGGEAHVVEVTAVSVALLDVLGHVAPDDLHAARHGVRARRVTPAAYITCYTMLLLTQYTDTRPKIYVLNLTSVSFPDQVKLETAGLKLQTIKLLLVIKFL